MTSGNRALLAANSGYFFVAAFSAIYIASESWHYGFWFTPFPLLLTAVALLFVGATTIGIIATTSGAWRTLVVAAAIAGWAGAAVSGSYLSGPRAINVMLQYFVPIIGLTMVGVAISAHVSSQDWSERALGAISFSALLLPVPLIAYCAIAIACERSAAASEVSRGFVTSERLLFGVKRERGCARFLHLQR